MTAPPSNLMQNSSSAQAIENMHKYMDAVCQIDVSSPGTGFLIRPYLVMTCCHILPDEKVAENAYARFEGTNPLRIKLAVKDFFLQNPYAQNEGKLVFDAEHLDFALVALQTTAEHVSQVLELSDRFPPQPQERVYIIQHPVIEVTKKDLETGRVTQAIQHPGDKCIAAGRICSSDQHLIHHNIPVAYGSSGAPILNSEGHLYAFHQGECSEHRNCYIGVRTDAIFRYMQEQKISLNNLERQVEQERLSNEEALLEKELKDIYLACNTLSVFSPGKKNGKWKLALSLDGIYTTLALLEGSQKQILQNQDINKKYVKDLLEGNFLVDESLFETKQLLTLESLFASETLQYEHYKHTLVFGVAGVGKSTLCQHIAHQWALGKLWTHYRAIFWLRLSEIKPEETWQAFLTRKYPHFSLSLLKEQNFRDQTLLLLDGYDEMPQAADKVFEELTNKNRFPRIFLTSRPQTVEFEANRQIEILGFNAQTIDWYITHFCESVRKYSSPLLEERISKLRNGFKRHPLAYSLAHIPINLTLLCTLTAEGDELLNTDTITMTTIYSRIVNWMYKWYWLRLKQNGKPAPSEATIRETTDPWKHKAIQPLARALEKIAWLGIQQEEFFYPSNLIEDVLGENALELDDLREVGLFRFENGSGHFMHSTFQEFFAACYLAHLYTIDRSQAQQWLEANKFNPRYQIVLRMTAGYLSLHATTAQSNKILQEFFNNLLASPRDLAQSYEISLLASCFEECECPDIILSHHSLFVAQVVSFLKTNLNSALSVALLQNNPKLFQHPKVIKEICENLEKYVSLLTDVCERKRLLPQQIIERLSQLPFTMNKLETLQRASLNGQDLSSLLLPLSNCLIDSTADTKIRRIIAWFFGKITYKDHLSLQNIISILITCLDTPSIRNEAAWALHRLTRFHYQLSLKGFISLATHLDDPKSCKVCSGTLHSLISLKQTFPKEAISILIDYINHPATTPDTFIEASTILDQLHEVGQLSPEESAARPKWESTSHSLNHIGDLMTSAGIKTDYCRFLQILFYFSKKDRKDLSEYIKTVLEEDERDPLYRKRALLDLTMRLDDRAVSDKAAEALLELSRAELRFPEEVLSLIVTFLGESNISLDTRQDLAAALRLLTQAGQQFSEQILTNLINYSGNHIFSKKIRDEIYWILNILNEKKEILPEEPFLTFAKNIRNPALSEKARSIAADALSQVGEETTQIIIPSLTECLTDKSAELCCAAAKTLAKLMRRGFPLSQNILSILTKCLQGSVLNAGIFEILEEFASQGHKFDENLLSLLINALFDHNQANSNDAFIVLNKLIRGKHKEAILLILKSKQEFNLQVLRILENAIESPSTLPIEIAKRIIEFLSRQTFNYECETNLIFKLLKHFDTKDYDLSDSPVRQTLIEVYLLTGRPFSS